MRTLLDVSAVPANPVGAGVYTIELARHLAPHLDLTLLARSGDADRWSTIAPSAACRAVVPNPRPARLLWEQTRAANVARTERLDLWHGPHYTMPLRSPVPVVVTMHDMTFFSGSEWHELPKVAYFRTMMKLAARKASVIVTVSHHTALQVQSALEPAAPVIPIPHGVDHDTFPPGTVGDDADLDALRAFGITRPYIAFAGTHEPRKNIPGLVQAFRRIAAAHPDHTLVLAGPDGWGSQAVTEAITAADLGTRIVRPGRLPYDVLPRFFRQADIVCYPSFVEGFGLPALETLASGGVLLSTTGSAVEEFVDDAACLVPPGDTDALTDALDALLRDDATRAALRRRGPAVAAPFTWKRSAALHLDAYQQALETTR